MADSGDIPLVSMELLTAEVMRDNERKVVVQAPDQLHFYKWIEIDGQDGLGGARYYGGYNFIIDGFATDPTTGETLTHLVHTPEDDILTLRDLSKALLAGEIEINLLPNQDVKKLITGQSLREVRQREEWNKKTKEEKLSLRREQKHCGTCTIEDCYCVRR